MMSLMFEASRLLGRGPPVDLVFPCGFLILYVTISSLEALVQGPGAKKWLTREKISKWLKLGQEVAEAYRMRTRGGKRAPFAVMRLARNARGSL